AVRLDHGDDRAAADDLADASHIVPDRGQGDLGDAHRSGSHSLTPFGADVGADVSADVDAGLAADSTMTKAVAIPPSWASERCTRSPPRLDNSRASAGVRANAGARSAPRSTSRSCQPRPS